MKKLVILSVFLPQILFSQDGILDTSFGTEGVFTFHAEDFGARSNEIVELSDHSLLFVGNSIFAQYGAQNPRGFYITKLTSNGVLDQSFGNNGYQFYPNGENGDSRFKMLIKQNDEKILLSVDLDGDAVLLRIDENGIPDSSFGENGIVHIDGNWPRINLQNDKIILEINYTDPDYGQMYSFSRRNTDGSLDLTFGDNGYALINPTNYTIDGLDSFIIQNDGKILISGQAYGGGTYFPGHATITRLNSNGSIDTTFGNNGTIINYFTNYVASWFEEIVLQNDGKIVTCGRVYYPNGTGGFSGVKPIVVRYNPDGSYDNSFGENGKVIFTETNFDANDSFRRLLVQPDSKILLGGTSSYPYPYNRTFLYLTRVSSNGTIDESFGVNGVVVKNFYPGQNKFTNYIEDLILTENGKIITIGHKTEDMQYRETFVARFKNDSLMDIEDFFNFPELVAYPNPTQDFITIKNIKDKFVLYNSIGQKINVPYIQKENGEFVLNLSYLPKGVYFLKTVNKSIKLIKD